MIKKQIFTMIVVNFESRSEVEVEHFRADLVDRGDEVVILEHLLVVLQVFRYLAHVHAFHRGERSELASESHHRRLKQLRVSARRKKLGSVYFSQPLFGGKILHTFLIFCWYVSFRHLIFQL